ncbi:hypothetical protein [Actinokineospora spheciospongiae]|uniref:hypothetical protein n=1 Tax=Actinokineospora spheciospongiae TaxID=909613 RepID=UPI000D891CAD|nr:hypothetical protein [Actinokineospora spheciospongiae]PWW67083.1 hypothetical protein DFQ13_101601 [Actinokineospora spheciospongiae]
MSERTAPAAPVVDAALWRTAFVVVPGTFEAATAVAVALCVLRGLFGEGVDRVLGELS